MDTVNQASAGPPPPSAGPDTVVARQQQRRPPIASSSAFTAQAVRSSSPNYLSRDGQYDGRPATSKSAPAAMTQDSANMYDLQERIGRGSFGEVYRA